MKLKRLILVLLTAIVVLLVGSSLVNSFNQPQITNRLELYQTDLLLQASALQENDAPSEPIAQARRAIVGDDPLGTALKQYEAVRASAQSNLSTLQSRLAATADRALADATPGSTTPPVPSTLDRELQKAIASEKEQIGRLSLNIGLLQAAQGDPATARRTWANIGEHIHSTATEQAIVATANVLEGLWADPAQLLPNAEQQLQTNLDGWFRATALGQLYELQQRQDALTVLQQQRAIEAEKRFTTVLLISSLPVVGSITGIVLLLVLGGQRLLRGKQAILSQNADLVWNTPWDGEVVWQVLIVGFFFIGQIALPLLLKSIGISFQGLGNRAQATYALTYYLLMAGSGLLVLYLSIRSYFPLPEGWFRLRWRSNWFLWGLGGYFVALPVMILVSLLNQQIWQGQGGSNPLLQIVLEEGDPIALGIFFFTAAIAAPLFEETLFRGFLLPSLTRYVPVWGAIALSSLVFAIAHLSLSEVIPLTVLGAILGLVYTRSRNLLAPMLLHSLWNSATMIGLLLLGSSVR